MVCEARERDEFRTPVSPEGLRTVQVTTDEKRDSHVGSQNAIRWTPDSRRFLFEREAPDDKTARPGAWLCDAEDGFSIRPIREWDGLLPWFTPLARDAEGVLGFQLDPDGTCLYEIRRAKEVLELRRTDVESGRSEALLTAPAPLTSGWLDVSADGGHVAIQVFLGDGKTEGAPWGMRVFDVKNAKTWMVELTNKHRKGAGYRKGAGHCAADKCAGVHDLLASVGPARLTDGSWLTPADGSWGTKRPKAEDWWFACVFRDDGTDFPRNGFGDCRVVALPDPPLYVTSHACWRGSRAESFVASMYNVTPERWRVPFIEARPVGTTVAGARPDRLPAEGRPVDLTRFVSRADACHFNFDASGRHVVTDTDGYVYPLTCMLYVGSYVEPEHGDAPYLKMRLLGIPRTSWKTQPAHPHPFLSPDGKFAVFQSDFSGRAQVHVAYGFEYP